MKLKTKSFIVPVGKMFCNCVKIPDLFCDVRTHTCAEFILATENQTMTPLKNVYEFVSKVK
jgi:hypothetical protein